MVGVNLFCGCRQRLCISSGGDSKRVTVPRHKTLFEKPNYKFTLNPAIDYAFCWWLCGLLLTSIVALSFALVSYQNHQTEIILDISVLFVLSQKSFVNSVCKSFLNFLQTLTFSTSKYCFNNSSAFGFDIND